MDKYQIWFGWVGISKNKLDQIQVTVKTTLQLTQ